MRDSSTRAQPGNIFAEPTTARDSAERAARLLEVFNSAVALDTVTDPALRASYQRMLNEYARQIDSVNRAMKKLSQIHLPTYGRQIDAVNREMQKHGPQLDSLNREMQTLRPQLDSLNREMQKHGPQLDSLNKEMQKLTQIYTPGYQRMLNAQHDSLLRALQNARLIYTDEHPQVQRLKRELSQLQQQLDGLKPGSDSLSREPSEPGCMAGGPPSSDGTSIVKLIMPETAAASGGRIRFGSQAASAGGAKVAFAQLGLTCVSSGPGEMRVFGLTPFNATRIVVQSALPLSVVVVTSSGRVLAGPLAVANETRDYDLRWAAR